MPPEDGEEEEAGNVSPEEQDMYDTVMVAALAQIYSDQTFPTVVEKLKSQKEEIGAGIGHTAAMILMSIKGAAEQQGKQIPDDVLFGAGQEVVAELIQVAIDAKLMDEAQTDDILQQAMLEGMKVFGQSEIDSGQVTPEMQAQAKADLAQVQAEQGGVPGQASAPQPKPAGIVAGGMQ
jgi:hypothetical protein